MYRKQLNIPILHDESLHAIIGHTYITAVNYMLLIM